MVYDGIINKPDIDEIIIEHYGVKGMKWRKRLKGKVSLLSTKVRRKLKGMSADQISYDNGKRTFERYDDGKAKSTSNPQGNRKYVDELEIDNTGYSLKSQAEKGRIGSGFADDYRVGADGVSRYIKKLKKK